MSEETNQLAQLEHRRLYAKSQRKLFYVTRSEHDFLRRMFTDLSNASVDLWLGTGVDINPTMRDRQIAAMEKDEGK